MNKKYIVLLALLFITGKLTAADFDYTGQLKINYPTKTYRELEFTLAYRQFEYEHEFQVGKKVYKVGGQPESYSFALVLEPNNLVRVMEFSKKQIEGFELEIGDYEIELKKRVLSKPVKGDYILSVQNVDYFFQQNLAQITFKFNDKGIKEVEVEGMVASLGVNEQKLNCEKDPSKCDGSGQNN